MFLILENLILIFGELYAYGVTMNWKVKSQFASGLMKTMET